MIQNHAKKLPNKLQNHHHLVCYIPTSHPGGFTWAVIPKPSRPETKLAAAIPEHVLYRKALGHPWTFKVLSCCHPWTFFFYWKVLGHPWTLDLKFKAAANPEQWTFGILWCHKGLKNRLESNMFADLKQLYSMSVDIHLVPGHLRLLRQALLEVGW